PRPTGLRFCLNSASLNCTPSDQLASLADPATKAGATGGSQSSSKSGQKATAVFAGGCFWCTEAVFEQLEGVSDVESGYVGGSKETANCDRVCDGDTGHAEAIRITYDPSKINYEQLLDVFFDGHDPTQLNAQGNDYGTQYRSAIFYVDAEQKHAAEAKIKELTDADKFSGPIVTTLEPLGEFYTAEAYHQDYARNNPMQPYIRAVSEPKVCKVR